MNWPIGRASTVALYATTAGRGVCADGVPITDPEGWIEVAMPADAVARAMPPTPALKIRVAPDDEATPCVYVDDVRAGARHYGGFHEFAAAGGVHWVAHLIEALLAAVAERVASGRRGEHGGGGERAVGR